MAAYVDGDQRALRQLFDRHAPRLLRIMTAKLGSEADARDIVQATFLNLHRARRDFRGGSRLQPWLYTIAYNLMRDQHRHRGRRPEFPSDPHEHELRSQRDRAPDAQPDVRLRAETVRGALSQLPDQQREVIELHWFSGFSFAEIAEIVGARRSAVKVRAHRGYKKLRLVLEAQGVTVAELEA